MFAIEVDGKLLVDSGVTPTNVPSIASTVRANPSAGFSIVSYTGTGSATTVGHGLNAAPSFIIAKRRQVNDWWVYHRSAGASKRLILNLTNSAATNNGIWNGTDPTSSVFSLGNSVSNTSGGTYIAYCFAPVAGYSAMGSYEGLGTAGGAFVYLGFRPALLIVKDVDGTWDWYMYDTARNTYNVVNNVLRPSGTNIEEGSATNNTFDFLSNGFKFRGGADAVNASDTYIYLAFAEAPFVTSGGVPGTAK